MRLITVDGPGRPDDTISIAGRPPVSFTSFLGRTREIEALLGLLTRDDVRLVTITGPGGVGKTRLAVEVARRIAVDRALDVTFVPLDALTDPGLVLSSISHALGVRDTAITAPREAVLRKLQDRRHLLVLDNFEQILAAAGDIAWLIARCAGLTVLLTSRAPLHLSGEYEFPTPPLAIPDNWPEGPVPTPESILASDVGKLFVDRARAVRPDFVLTRENASSVAEVCRRLDGLPLAIELAAARTKVLTPAALAARVSHRLHVLTRGPRDLPLRHQTMRDAIAWSYDLLVPEEQALLRHLSVFANGFSLEAADFVMNGQSDADSLVSLSVLDSIASLVDNSLLRAEETVHGEQRFKMLEVVREYAEEQAEARGESEQAHNRHANWFARWTASGEEAFFRHDEPDWISRLDLEMPNIRAALQWADSTQNIELGLRIIGSLWWYWVAGGHAAEGIRRLETLLPRATDDVPTVELAATFEAAGLIYWGAMQLDDADAHLTRALSISREIHRPVQEVRVLHWLSMVARYREDFDTMIAYAQAALDLGRTLGNPIWIGNPLGHLGQAAFRQGRIADGRVLLAEAIATIRMSGYKRGLAWVLQLLADLEAASNNVATAAQLQQESLRLNREVADHWGLYEDLYALGVIANAAGRPEDAATMLAAATGLREHDGVVPRVSIPMTEETVARVASVLSEDAFAAAWSTGLGLSLAQTLDRADLLAGSIASEPAAQQPRRTPPVSAAPKDDAQTQRATDHAEPPRSILTKREHDVFALLAEGRSDREIAAALSISPKTAGNHVTNILGKLGVGSRAAAVAYGVRHGLI